VSFSLVSWNVNSLRVRLPLVLRYLDEHEPDVVCLQETRIADAGFPRAAFEERGYVVATACSSGYAGVAIASREPIEDTVVGIAGFVEAKAPGRRLACRIAGRWIDTVYVPTRTAIGKVAFLDALRDDYATRLRGSSLVLAGDFNICFDARDYASPSMISAADVHPARPEDLAFRGVLDQGLHDCFRERHDDGGHFSWFPLTPWAVKRNYGMRLDYVFATRALAEHVEDVVHDREPSAWPRPSDHVPVIAHFQPHGAPRLILGEGTSRALAW
jgi:exodeoxyribonuclease-3